MMRVVDVLAVPVQAGFFCDDRQAIRAGAGHDGFDYAAWDALLTSMADGPRRLQPVNLPELAEAKA
jgi:hypothetical protein